MKRTELIKILNEEFPPKSSFEGDYIGLQVKGDEEITNIVVGLDLTLQVIMQAIQKDANMIIVHHPLFFGDKEELLTTNPFLKSKYDLLRNKNINVFVIHTNADFNKNSISRYQAKLLKLTNLKAVEKGTAIYGEYDRPIELLSFGKILKLIFPKLVDIRTAIIPGEHLNKFIVASGAAGEIIYQKKHWDKTFIVGELKHHQWVFAIENNIKVIEIGHFTENVFSEIVIKFLDQKINSKTNQIFKAEEEHVFKTI